MSLTMTAIAKSALSFVPGACRTTNRNDRVRLLVHLWQCAEHPDLDPATSAVVVAGHAGQADLHVAITTRSGTFRVLRPMALKVMTLRHFRSLEYRVVRDNRAGEDGPPAVRGG
jgi:hypothetical protein